MAGEPRTRQNPLERPEGPRSECFDAGGNLTCPRCGWPAHVLLPSYYDSPWNEHGGTCCECAIEANSHHDRVGWPSPNKED